MFSKLQSPRTQLLTIACSTVLPMLVAGLSAYLTDKADYSSTFVTASGSEFGITLTGNTYDGEVIFPGEDIDLNPTVENSGSYDVYAFVETDMSSDFSIENVDPTWSQLGDSNIYYYGSPDTVEPLSSDHPVPFSGVHFSEEVDTPGADYEVTITAYAVQTTGVDPDPAEAWKLAQGNSSIPDLIEEGEAGEAGDTP